MLFQLLTRRIFEQIMVTEPGDKTKQRGSRMTTLTKQDRLEEVLLSKRSTKLSVRAGFSPTSSDISQPQYAEQIQKSLNKPRKISSHRTPQSYCASIHLSQGVLRISLVMFLTDTKKYIQLLCIFCLQRHHLMEQDYCARSFCMENKDHPQ